MSMFRKPVGASIIDGDKELNRLMKYLRVTAARRITTAGAWEASDSLRRHVKAAVPSTMKQARKAIGRRKLKVKEAPGGGAKIGGRVGPSSKAYAGKNAARRAKKGRKGVGIGVQNIHWFFEDAKHRKRRTKTPRRRTGTMLEHTRGIPSVSKVAVSRRSEMVALFRRGSIVQLNKEIKKGKAFA